jgi:hypothetical protein
MQISVQTFSELLIFARITDETGIKLEGASHQRFHIGDHVIGHTSPAEEYLRDIAVRTVKRINADGRRTGMLYGLKSLSRTEVHIREYRPFNISLSEASPGEVRLAEVRPGEGCPGEKGLAEIRPMEVCPDEVCPSKVSPGEIRPGEACLGEICPGEMGLR